MSAFEVLSKIDCSEHVEQKGRLSYLSWAWAWKIFKQHYPASFYTIYENKDGLFYHTDGRTCWVKTGVTLVDDDTVLEHVEYLPVMDNQNKSIAAERVTSFDVNKAIQRSLTKAVARHGLGLYIYAGEDLPEDADKPEAPECAECGKGITPVEVTTADGKTAKFSVSDIIGKSKGKFGRMMCWDCCCKAGKAV